MNKQTLKSSKTKQRLCDVYMDLYRCKDINKITIKEITEKAGYNRSTFYIYYRDVYDLHNKIKKELIKNNKNNIQSLIKTNNLDFKNIFSAIVSFYLQNEKYLTPFITKDNDFYKNIKETIKPILEEAFNKNINKNKYTDYLIEYHLSSVFSVLNYWIQNKKNISSDELFNLLEQILTKGVFNVLKDL